MKLAFVHIGNIRGKEYNLDFSFSNEYFITYNNYTLLLNIEEKEKNENQIYGDNIDSIHAIVGKNGVGKSTVMKTIGLCLYGNIRENPYTEYVPEATDTWFILYQMDSYTFFLEWDGKKYLLDKIKFIDTKYKIVDMCSENKIAYLLYMNYADRYDDMFSIVSTPLCIATGKGNIQRYNANKVEYSKCMEYIWEYSNKILDESHPYDVDGYIEITVLNIIKSYGIYGKVSSDLKKYLKNIYNNHDIDIMVSYLAYNEVHRIYSGTLNCKEYICICYLESVLLHYVFIHKTNSSKYTQRYDYGSIKDYLINSIAVFSKKAKDVAKNIVEGIEEIPDKYIRNIGLGTHTFRIYFNEMDKNYLQKLMNGLDVSEELYNKEIIQFKHTNKISISFHGFSSGEISYIRCFSAIYSILKKMCAEKNERCILLIDEPEDRFHPEWSRQYISNLIQLLNHRLFKRMKYQVIISTHSPIILSDIISDNIFCMEKNSNGEVMVFRSKYGFLSNINDMLADTFYTKSIFGRLAEEYVNDIIKRLNRIEKKSQDSRYSREYIREALSSIKEQYQILSNDFVKNNLDNQVKYISIKLGIEI